MSHWWWLLCFVPASIVQTFLHEASHALVAKALGARITEFRFLPYKADNTHVYLGRIIYAVPAEGWSDEKRRAVALAPLIFGVIPFLVCAQIPAWPAWVYTTAAAVDLFYGYAARLFGDEEHDINQVPDVPTWGCISVALSILAIWVYATILLRITT